MFIYRPFVLKANEWPLDVEDVVADHVWFAVFDQELKVVHGFLNVLLMQHVADETQVDISWRGTKSNQKWLNTVYHFFSSLKLFSGHRGVGETIIHIALKEQDNAELLVIRYFALIWPSCEEGDNQKETVPTAIQS